MATKSGRIWLWLGLAALIIVGGAAAFIAKRGTAASSASQGSGDDAQNIEMADERWVIAEQEGAALAVPKDWENLDRFSPQVLIFRKSNGKGGVPAQDEAGAPLQAQMILEYIRMDPSLVDSANVVADRILKTPQTEIAVRPIGEFFKLSDGTEAFFMSTEIVKDGKERELMMKLLAKRDDNNGYVVTGSITASKDSQIPSINSKQGQWLKTLVRSLVRDASRLDKRAVHNAYVERDKP
jgi:hypothetical protein